MDVGVSQEVSIQLRCTRTMTQVTMKSASITDWIYRLILLVTTLQLLVQVIVVDAGPVRRTRTRLVSTRHGMLTRCLSTCLFAELYNTPSRIHNRRDGRDLDQK
jgi:hypothetical protein